MRDNTLTYRHTFASIKYHLVKIGCKVTSISTAMTRLLSSSSFHKAAAAIATASSVADAFASLDAVASSDYLAASMFVPFHLRGGG